MKRNYWPNALKHFDYFWLMTSAFEVAGFPKGAPIAVQPLAFKRLEAMGLLEIVEIPSHLEVTDKPFYYRAVITAKGQQFLVDQSNWRVQKIKSKEAKSHE